MKKHVVCMGVLPLLALTLCAADKTWTGGAGNALFSSSANWSPAGAPADGDALLFSNSSDIGVVNDIVGRTFSGITVSGSGPVTLQAAGNGFSLTGTLTVSGTRELNLLVPVTLTNAVTFNLSGANLYAYSAISGTGSATLEGGKDFYAKDAVSLTGGVIANKGRIRIERTSFTAPVTLNQLRTNGVSYVALFFQNSGTYNVPITITSADGSDYTLQTASSAVYVTNTAPITIAPSAYVRWQPSGSITFAGGITLQDPVSANGMSIIFNGNNVIRGVPLAFTNTLFSDSGTLRLAVASNTYAYLKCYTHTVFTDVPYALDPKRIVGFGTSYKKYGTLDINGNSQIIDRPNLDTTSLIDTSDYNLTSSSGPATLTCNATGSSTFFGSLNGALSLSWEPVSNAHIFTITGRTSQTTGTLQVKAGTLLLAAGTNAFPNISGLIASGSSNTTLRVENAALSAAMTLTITNAAWLSLPNGIALTCRSAQIDGTALTTGVYSATSTVNGRTFITGSGTLTVLTIPLSGIVRTWTGAGANTLFSSAANWDTAPSFDGSETFLFSAAGTNATLDGTFLLGAILYNRSTPFTLAPADGSAGIRLGLGGITTLAPVAGITVTHTNAAPLTLLYGHEFQIASNQTLAITGRISGGTPTNPFIKTGDGTLRLTGTNTFESPFVLSNGYVNVNSGTAFGNPTNTITIPLTTNPADSWNRRGSLYFSDTVATNDRPITYGSSVYYIGQIYPKNGTLVLNGKFTFLGGGRIDNQGTLLFRGGFDSRSGAPWMQTAPGYVMRFEGQPLVLGTQGFTADNGGTFHVSTGSNSCQFIALTSGTFLCGARDAMPTNCYVIFGQSWTQSGFVDLNGFDQQVKFLTYNGSSGGGATNMVVKSTAPATLTLQGDASMKPFVGYFSGKASLRHRNTGTLAFTDVSSASTTTGDLLIEAGTVAFRTGATWKGSTNITVTAGALSVEGGSGTTFGGSNYNLNRTRLRLTSASTVNLAAGISEYVYSATLDGTRLPVGTYGSPTSAAQYKSARFTGTGILTVMSSGAPGTLIRML
jgi:autotransporter-associated beta strand protein